MERGTRLGHYEVVEQLGVGGMGEVYRARDARLDRDVALKVLPDRLSADPERLQRLEREAKLLASLGHGNIAAVHGFEEWAGVRFIVMELVEGSTLAELIEEKGPLDLDQALGIADRIAEALEFAHNNGVIHRDLKPANVKVAPDGHVKVLDFGLAKALTGEATGGLDGSHSPTVTRGSALGVILGTAPYMSPEQARGRQLDKRTDVWSFGCVLYEMLTGRVAFGREDISDTIAAVLRDEIELRDLPEGTPPAVSRLLARCLERDPRQRLRDMGDARLEIQDALEWRGPEDSGVPGARPARGRLPWWAAVAAGLVTALVVWGLTRPGPVVGPGPSRFLLRAPPGVQVSGPALAPDGRSIAFAGTRDGQSRIYLRDLDQLEAIPVVGSEGGRAPFFSPDGEWIGFASGSASGARAELKRIPRGGGRALSICEGSYDGATWGPDDNIVLGSRRGLQIVPASGGVPEPLTSVVEGEQHRHPHYLPGGRDVLFYVWRGSLDSTHVDVYSLDTEERRRLVDGTSPRFSRSGHLLFAREESLWAVPFEPDRLTLRGEPVRVVDQLHVEVGGLASFSLSDDGSLVYATGGTGRPTDLVSVDLEGRGTPIPTGLPNHDFPRISPDGTRVAFGSFGEDGTRDIWIYNLARSILTRFTFDPESDTDSSWSPDGQRVLFHSHRDGVGGNLYWRAVAGTGEVEQLTSGTGERVATGWAPDGSSLVFWGSSSDRGYDLYLLELDGERRQRPLLQTPANEASATISPDGRWLAYESDETGRSEVYVRPFPDVEQGKWQVSFDGGQAPVWNADGFGPDGGELIYQSGPRMRRVQVDTTTGFAAGVPETLFEGSYVESRIDGRRYDLSPDGQWFIMLEEGELADDEEAGWPMVLVIEWAAELEGPRSQRP